MAMAAWRHAGANNTRSKTNTRSSSSSKAQAKGNGKAKAVNKPTGARSKKSAKSTQPKARPQAKPKAKAKTAKPAPAEASTVPHHGHSESKICIRNGTTLHQLFQEWEAARAAGTLLPDDTADDADAANDADDADKEEAKSTPKQSQAASAGKKGAPVSIKGLITNYPRLLVQFGALEERNASTNEMMREHSPDYEPEPAVDMSDLMPLRESDDLPFTTDSITNKFCMLVWRMLSACESGSIGGDACRMADVLEAAVCDVANNYNIRGKASQFEHAFGLALAIQQHGMHSWRQRGHMGNGQLDFNKLGGVFVKLFKIPVDELAELGISAELRQMAIDVCTSLQTYLKDTSEFPYSEAIKFKFMVKPRAAKRGAVAAGSSGGQPAKKRSLDTMADQPGAGGHAGPLHMLREWKSNTGHWKEVWDPNSGRTYWYNALNTKQVMWNVPWKAPNWEPADGDDAIPQLQPLPPAKKKRTKRAQVDPVDTPAEYAGYTHEAAEKYKSWAVNIDVKAAQKNCFQLRCKHEDGRFRVIVVGGAMPLFALNRFVAEAFGLGVEPVDYRPLNGKAPPESLFMCESASNSKALVCSKASANAIAGKGKAFIPERSIKVSQALRTRGDCITYVCGDNEIEVQVDGLGLQKDVNKNKNLPRCVGKDDDSMDNYDLGALNSRYRGTRTGQSFITFFGASQEHLSIVEANSASRPIWQEDGTPLHPYSGFGPHHRFA